MHTNDCFNSGERMVEGLKRVVYIGAEPDGPHYGFPKRVPEEYITWYGSTDYGLSPEVRKWMTREGYPGVNGKNVRIWHQMRLVDE
jgi:hypothetical protein